MTDLKRDAWLVCQIDNLDEQLERLVGKIDRRLDNQRRQAGGYDRWNNTSADALLPWALRRRAAIYSKRIAKQKALRERLIAILSQVKEGA